MDDFRGLLEQHASTIGPRPDALAETKAAHRKRAVRHRIVAGVVGFGVFVALIAGAVALSAEHEPAQRPGSHDTTDTGIVHPVIPIESFPPSQRAQIAQRLCEQGHSMQRELRDLERARAELDDAGATDAVTRLDETIAGERATIEYNLSFCDWPQSP